MTTKTIRINLMKKKMNIPLGDLHQIKVLAALKISSSQNKSSFRCNLIKQTTYLRLINKKKLLKKFK